MKALILANGRFPKTKKLINELKNASFLAVCDGAIKHIDSLGIIPNIIIGDLDSIDSKMKQKYKDKLVHIKEQNSNDLSKAFFYCKKRGFDDFVILGATGKREDHTLANISLLLYYSKFCKNVVIKSDYGEFRVYNLCKNKLIIDSQKGGQISIFCFDKTAKLDSKNLKYPLKNLSLKNLSSGSLNEALSNNFSLKSSIEVQVIIYFSK